MAKVCTVSVTTAAAAQTVDKPLQISCDRHPRLTAHQLNTPANTHGQGGKALQVICTAGGLLNIGSFIVVSNKFFKP